MQMSPLAATCLNGSPVRCRGGFLLPGSVEPSFEMPGMRGRPFCWSGTPVSPADVHELPGNLFGVIAFPVGDELLEESALCWRHPAAHRGFGVGNLSRSFPSQRRAASAGQASCPHRYQLMNPGRKRRRWTTGQLPDQERPHKHRSRWRSPRYSGRSYRPSTIRRRARRPSASFSTSMVLPERVVMTSPGRWRYRHVLCHAGDGDNLARVATGRGPIVPKR